VAHHKGSGAISRRGEAVEAAGHGEVPAVALLLAVEKMVVCARLRQRG
jgi:hypothetical protein